MTAVPTPTLVLPREEWPDADFDLPEGAAIPAPSDKEEEDWDIEMDLGKTGDSKPKSLSAILATRSEATPSISSMINIRPPIQTTVVEDDDEGVSTIKASAVSTITARPVAKPKVEPVDEDFEDAFSLPTELTQLSLAPLSLSHRASKNSLEWGEKDNSSSSQSSDAYSTLGFAEASSSSNSASSASFLDPETETEEDEDELEGLVIPSALFESGHSASQLKKILECKKTTQPKGNSCRPSKFDPEDDFETGLVFDDDIDLSPSRLIFNAHHSQRSANHSSIPVHKQSVLRPPSRTRLQRSKSPSIPPTSSIKQLQKIRLSPSPPLFPPPRSQNFQALASSFQAATPLPAPSNNLLSPKPGSLRGQKSCTGLKPPSPPSTKKLSRKASLSSLFDSQALASSSTTLPTETKIARYEEPTAASRAKSHKTSTSRIHDFKVPPTRPSTPSSNTAALRLTMPTQSRLRSRPALSQIFGAQGPSQESPVPRAPSPLPPRPPSSSSIQTPAISRSQTRPTPLAPKLLRRPKRPRTYGDGTELDHIEDLPTDRDKEVCYRVQPKGYGNRIPGATFPSKTAEKSKTLDKGTARRKGKWEGAVSQEPPTLSRALSTNTLRRTTTRIGVPELAPGMELSPKKKRKKPTPPPSGTSRRRPTLIRNLGGTAGSKVVGEMKWNPQTLRWEGNEQILRDFDAAIGTSTRPALITHLTASFIGAPGGSSSARVVGNMVFDPSRMCWISTLPPEQDEPDVFANLADDEEDEWDQKGATIRANAPRVSDVSATTSSSSDAQTGRTSPAPSHSRTMSDSGSDRGSRASMVVCDIDDAFVASCRRAEERHRVEMKGWKTSTSQRDTSLASDRSYLHEIRALATRQY